MSIANPIKQEIQASVHERGNIVGPLKPRVLLVPNVAWWVIGEMARHIMTALGSEFDFYFLPERLIFRRPDMLRTIVNVVDLVHCLNESSAAVLSEYVPRGGPPIVSWIHHVTHWSPEHEAASQKSAALIACTPGWRDIIATHTQGRQRICVVRHGVDSDHFRRLHSERAKLGIPENAFVIGFVGTKGSDHDNNRKDTDTFVRTIRTVAPHIPNLFAMFAGPGWDAEIALLRRDGLAAGNIGYVRRANVPKLFSSMDIYLMTSRVEGGPCTVLEAMACETPVVATRVGLVSEILQDGVNGFSADPGDVATLADGILKIAADSRRAAEMGRNARQTVMRYPWAQTLKPLSALYKDVIGSQSKMPRQADPAWLGDPQRLMGPSRAADSFLEISTRVRRGSMRFLEGLRMLPEMLDGITARDRIRGLALIRGWAFHASGSHLKQEHTQQNHYAYSGRNSRL